VTGETIDLSDISPPIYIGGLISGKATMEALPG
jgi:hypothetical protein